LIRFVLLNNVGFEGFVLLNNVELIRFVLLNNVGFEGFVLLNNVGFEGFVLLNNVDFNISCFNPPHTYNIEVNLQLSNEVTNNIQSFRRNCLIGRFPTNVFVRMSPVILPPSRLAFVVYDAPREYLLIT